MSRGISMYAGRLKRTTASSTRSISRNAVTESVSSVPATHSFSKDLELRAEVPHPVVQQRIVDPLAQPGRAADHHHRRLLGVGPGDRIAEAQPADAIRHADRPDAVDAGVGVGGEPGAVFARAADHADRALFQHAVEREHVVAGNAEDVANAVVLQPADQVLADRQPGFQGGRTAKGRRHRADRSGH